MTLSRVYRRSVVYPGIIMLPLVTIFSIIENRNYESEWLTKEAAIQMTIVAVFLYICFMCLLALPVFLNKREKIRSNIALSALSWFLLPGIFMILVIGKALNEYLTVDSSIELVYALAINFPFVVGLIWGFRKFRKQVQKMPPLSPLNH